MMITMIMMMTISYDDDAVMHHADAILRKLSIYIYAL